MWEDKVYPIQFVKMNGLGNDFVVVDDRLTQATPTPKTIQALANRHAGIGCDQVLWLTPPESDGGDFLYRIFNADGTEVGQCGNGARCIGHYVALFHPNTPLPIVLRTVAGKRLTVDHGPCPNHYQATMGQPMPIGPQASLDAFDTVVLEDQTYRYAALDFGNPHMIIFYESPWSELRLSTWGQALQRHPRFPEGVNVSFVKCVGKDRLAMRVYERGVGETQACASGACAAAVASHLAGWVSGSVSVTMPGGQLTVTWPHHDAEVTQSGAVELVFMGQWGFEVHDPENPNLFCLGAAKMTTQIQKDPQ